MALTGWMKAKMRPHVSEVIKTQVRQTLETLMPQLLEFYNSPKEDRQLYYELTEDPARTSLKDRLVANGVTVEEVDVDIADFQSWMDDFAKVSQHFRAFGAWSIEKCLEHYLVQRFLRILPGDTYIDIGAQTSPFARTLKQRGTRAYRLDLSYKPGVHGMDIGADASNTELPNGFADTLSMQDLFHILPGDADIRFVQEAARILNNTGRCAIVPIHLVGSYVNIVDPWSDLRNIHIDNGAKRIWQEDGKRWGVVFTRYYSPESFAERVWANIPDSMVAKIVYCKNLPEIICRYPGQHIYALFTLCCEKRMNVFSLPDQRRTSRSEDPSERMLA
jgi:hypothetical protein